MSIADNPLRAYCDVLPGNKITKSLVVRTSNTTFEPKWLEPKPFHFHFQFPPALFLITVCLLVEFWWCSKRRGPKAAGVSHDNPRTPKVHNRGPRRFIHHQNSTRRPRREGRKKENCGGKGKKSEILGPPPFGAPPFGPHFFWVGPPTLRPPTLRPPPFGPPTLLVPTFRTPTSWVPGAHLSPPTHDNSTHTKKN